MTTYIAQFRARHKTILIEQNSIFTWKQESGEIDADLLVGKIIRESSRHFYKLLAGEHYPISMEDITVEIAKTSPFHG